MPSSDDGDDAGRVAAGAGATAAPSGSAEARRSTGGAEVDDPPREDVARAAATRPSGTSWPAPLDEVPALPQAAYPTEVSPPAGPSDAAETTLQAPPFVPWGRLAAAAYLANPTAGGPDPDSGTTATTWAPRAGGGLLDIGRRQLDAGRATAALARFKRAVARAPRDPDAWFALALARTDLRQTPLARAAARRALVLEPRHADATLLLGFLAQQQRNPTAAKQLYSHYLELEPQGPWADEVRSVLAQLP